MRRWGNGMGMALRAGPLCAAGLLWWFASAPAAALQVLEGADHAELTAEVSSGAVNRIALEGDRIARVVQSGSAFALEHDPVRGDLYLYPSEGGAAAGPGIADDESDRAAGRPGFAGAPAPVILYVGSERGFTYRLTLTTAARESAQILIRNPAALRAATGDGAAAEPGARQDRGEVLAALVRAAATRRTLPGYAIVPATNETGNAPIVREQTGNVNQIEVWRGPRFTAHVLEVRHGTVPDARALAELYGPTALAAWLGPVRGPADSRLADSGVADTDSAGDRVAGGGDADDAGLSDPNAAVAGMPRTRPGVVVVDNPAPESGR